MKKQALMGIMWTGIDAIGSRVVSLIIQVILARLLLPADFGIIGMITIFIAISQTLLDSGFQNALIRESKVTNKEYSTVFLFNLGMSVFLYSLLFIFSNMIATFYATPILSKILKVLGLILIINSFGLIQRTILTRNLNFRLQTKINLFSVIISGIIAVLMAKMGYGVWSLVIQQLSNQFMQSFLLMYFNRWMPTINFDLIAFKKFFSFGWKLTLSSIINTLYQNIFYVVIGKYYSPTDLGYYTNSQKFNDVPVQSMTQAIQKVTYPLLSKMNTDGINLKQNYRIIIRYSSAFSFMMMLALGASADRIIPFLFGNNWINSVPYFQILCFGGMLYPINAINLNILQVKGRSDLFLKLEVIKKIVGVSFILVSFFANTGIYGLVWSGVLATLFNTSLNILVSSKIIDYSYREQLADLAVFFLNALIMAVIIFCIGKISIFSSFITLIFQATIGILVYLIFGNYILRIPEINTIILFIKKRLVKE
ncbi:lipopolysaccharide biosynthesis protein [Enterococcus casseliflavus]|uniref:lipopolysaccharide biosynthesis protein n=1 Tax=Enterococcus casseliflavus TaxID=37734 RepID=UPI003D13B77F